MSKKALAWQDVQKDRKYDKAYFKGLRAGFAVGEARRYIGGPLHQATGAPMGDLVMDDVYRAKATITNSADSTLSKGFGVMVHHLLAAYAPSLAVLPQGTYWAPDSRSTAQRTALAAGFPDITIAMAHTISRQLAEAFPGHTLVEIETTTPHKVGDDVYKCTPDAILEDQGEARYVVEYKTHWGAGKTFPTQGALDQAMFNAACNGMSAIVVDAWPSAWDETDGCVATALTVVITTCTAHERRSA